MSIYIGVDIGASTVKLGLYDTERGIIGSRRDYPARANEGPGATMAVIKDAAGRLLAENGIEPSGLAGAGACCPTPIDLDGMCVYPTNIDDSWQGVNVKKLLSDTLGVPAVLLNDGDAAAYREYQVRRAGGADSPLMAQLITGTGLGGAVIINGEILVGPLPATELGHIQTDSSPDADSCGCGSTGCAEGKSSLMGLRNLVRRRQARGDVPAELQGEPMSVAKTLRRLGQQDVPSEEVMGIWKTYFNNLGTLARIVANSFGCDLIVISGGAQEREDGASDEAYRRFLADGVRWIRENLEAGFPHLRQIKVEWAIDEIPDSACYGTAQYAAVHLK
jgi:glucokinase